MNANEFWHHQLKKNANGKPQYTVHTEPDTPEEELMDAWIDKWQEHFAYFDNKGCGCCINIYEFDVPQEAAVELPISLVFAYEE